MSDGPYTYVRVGHLCKDLAWEDIRDRIDWCLGQRMKFWRQTERNAAWTFGEWHGFVVDFIFDRPQDAALFKLAWGGR